MPCLQGSHKNLVDGTHNEAGEEPLLSATEPAVSCERRSGTQRFSIVFSPGGGRSVENISLGERFIGLVEPVFGVSQEHGVRLNRFAVFLRHVGCLVFHPFDNTVKESIRCCLSRCSKGYTGATGRLRKELCSDETGFSLTLTHGCFDAHHAATLHRAYRFDDDFLHGA